MRHNIMDVLETVKGSSFASIDTMTEMGLRSRLDESKEVSDTLSAVVRAFLRSGIKKNPYVGKIFRRVDSTSVQLFTNSKTNGYENMVKRRLEKEGKSADDFSVGKPVWGSRIADLPIVEHNGEYYLECIVQGPGTATYYFDTENKKNRYVEIPYSEIIGTSPVTESTKGQGGLEGRVNIVRYRLSSLRGIRVGGAEFVGEFFYEEPAKIESEDATV